MNYTKEYEQELIERLAGVKDGECGQTHSFKELLSNDAKNVTMGFCLNVDCRFPRTDKCRTVEGRSNRGGFTTLDRKQVECPHCSRIVYWTTRYSDPMDNQRKQQLLGKLQRFMKSFHDPKYEWARAKRKAAEKLGVTVEMYEQWQGGVLPSKQNLKKIDAHLKKEQGQC